MTPDGLYQFTQLPIGLCNAPSIFKRLMDSVLGSMKWSMCLAYMDDMLIFSDTFEEHLHRLDSVLDAIAKACLILNVIKSQFFVSELGGLGIV